MRKAFRPRHRCLKAPDNNGIINETGIIPYKTCIRKEKSAYNLTRENTSYLLYKGGGINPVEIYSQYLPQNKTPHICLFAVEITAAVCLTLFVLLPLTKPRAEIDLPQYDNVEVKARRSVTEPDSFLLNTTAINSDNKLRQNNFVQIKPTELVMLPEMAELYSQNNDFAGWIKIAGTPIDYPVMYKPEELEYYLYRDFNGEKDPTLQGSLYIDELNIIEPRDTNLLIHGHNMKNGSMFHTLENYKYEEYFLKHPTIQYKTLYENEEYEIFAAFVSHVLDEVETAGFIYYKFLNADNETEFNNAIQSIKELQLYDTEITPVYGDQLITLSTCEYSQDNGRMAVMARKIR